MYRPVIFLVPLHVEKKAAATKPNICTSRKNTTQNIYLLRSEVNFACEQSILFSSFTANCHCDIVCYIWYCVKTCHVTSEVSFCYMK